MGARHTVQDPREVILLPPVILLCNVWSDAFKHLTLEEVMPDITDMQNSLNIHFTGIHAFENLFSVKSYENETKMKYLQ